MKYTLTLLLMGSCAIAHAGPIHRCVDHQGQLTFQNNPCPNIEAKLAKFQPDERSATTWSRKQNRMDSHAEGQRVQKVLRANKAETSALDASNRRRCQSALREARMCGRFAGMFSCGERGFQREEPTAKNSVDLLLAVKGGGEANMQRCVEQASE
ncbi:DUF4124 domain-containing protein [Stenotrophobium rhamnosiphilum]|nr:DUF4124 domain-containing protein [Stenotrophobium rhamnosiphilum]